jgi:hypothetical protein
MTVGAHFSGAGGCMATCRSSDAGCLPRAGTGERSPVSGLGGDSVSVSAFACRGRVRLDSVALVLFGQRFGLKAILRVS